ncbi:MAG TPA: hypothetical protein VGH85_15440 [Mycobacteriales bacterium]
MSTRQFGLEVTPNPDRAVVRSDRALAQQTGTRSLSPSTVHPGAESADAVISLGKTVGNAAIARRLGPAARRRRPWAPPLSHLTEVLNAPGSVRFPPFGVLTTWGELAVAAQFAVKEMARATSAIGSDEGVRAGAAQWTEEMEGWIAYSGSMGEEMQLGQWEATQISDLLIDRTTIAEGGHDIQATAVASPHQQVHAAAMAAAAEAEKLQSRLDQSMWAAFSTEDSGRFTKAAGLAASALEIGLGLRDIAREAAEEIDDASAVHLGPISRYAEGLTRLSQALSTINLGLSSRDEARSTELEKGMRQVSLVAETFSRLTTTVGEVLPATIHLVAVAKKIVAEMSQLTDQLHAENKEWIELTGRQAGYSAEVGNKEARALWHFMNAAMRAHTSADIPAIDAALADFIVGHRELFGARAGVELSTTDWWRWRSLASSDGRNWFFSKRHAIWAMLYGGVKPRE